MIGDVAFSTTIADATGLDPLFPWPLVKDTASFLNGWRAMASGATALNGTHQLAIDGIEAAVDVRGRLDAALQGARDSGTSTNELLNQLVAAAHLIASGSAPKVIYVNGFGSFDTHSDQPTRLAVLY